MDGQSELFASPIIESMERDYQAFNSTIQAFDQLFGPIPGLHEEDRSGGELEDLGSEYDLMGDYFDEEAPISEIEVIGPF